MWCFVRKGRSNFEALSFLTMGGNFFGTRSFSKSKILFSGERASTQANC